jgi:hypothetical protein
MQNLAPSGVSALALRAAHECALRHGRASGRGIDGEKPPRPLRERSGMVCQYSTRGLVSSGKRDRVLDPGAAEGGEDASEVATGTVIVGHSPALSEPLTAITRGAHATHVWRSRSCGRWSVADTRLDRLHQTITR